MSNLPRPIWVYFHLHTDREKETCHKRNSTFHNFVDPLLSHSAKKRQKLLRIFNLSGENKSYNRISSFSISLILWKDRQHFFNHDGYSSQQSDSSLSQVKYFSSFLLAKYQSRPSSQNNYGVIQSQTQLYQVTCFVEIISQKLNLVSTIYIFFSTKYIFSAKYFSRVWYGYLHIYVLDK